MALALDPDNPRSPSTQVADALRQGIRAGEYQPGERLPSVADLKERFGVASGTVQAALRVLREEGLVVSWQGRGTYVRKSEPETGTAPDLATVIRQLDRLAEGFQRLTDRVDQLEQVVREHPRDAR